MATAVRNTVSIIEKIYRLDNHKLLTRIDILPWYEIPRAFHP